MYKMTESVVKVRAKTKEVHQKRGIPAWPYTGGAVVAATAAALAFGVYSGNFGILSPQIDVVETSAGRVIKVPPGGSIQTAIDRATSGDIIELQAGATYFGEIKLANKPLTDFVTIQSSEATQLPADKRVSPSDAASMAKIVTRGQGKPAVSAENGSNHYRFVGIEFTASNADYIYNLVLLGSGETKPADVPHDIEIDRSYLHPFKSGVVRRGLALNSANTVIKNSYFEGFGFAGEETQGICGWTGTRNVKVLNNYVEGGAENIMFGGSDIASADLIPTDIEVRGNYLKKRDDWKGKVSLKTLFELKNAKKVQFVGNYIENNWVGSAFRVTVRNETGGSPYNTIEDVLIKDNVINGAGEGVNILGSDNNFPSQTLKRLTITNNLFLNIGGSKWEGSGYFFQIADGENILIANNTSMNAGNIATIYGEMPVGLVVRDNIIGHGNYGIHGPIDLKSAGARMMFVNNVFVNSNRLPPSDFAFPPGNSIISELRDVGFIDPSGNDFRLASNSRYKGKGLGGKNIGADLAWPQLSQNR